MAENLKK
nr:ORFV1 protein [Streptococcus thermophilus]